MDPDKKNADTLSYCGDLVYREDRDRFLSAMTAPAGKREALMALYAFNHEVSKTAGVVSETMLGQIRLQWWREAIDECYAGKPRRHAVVTALADAVQQAGPSRDLFEEIIDGRERDLEFDPPQGVEDLEAYAAATSGGLSLLALEICLGRDERGSDFDRNAARQIGTAWAMIGLMRALPFHMRARRGMLPRKLAAEYGVSGNDLAEGRNVPGLSRAVAEVCRHAGTLLAAARDRRKTTVSHSALYGALSIGVLADSYLKQLRKVDFDVFDRRLAAPPALRGLSLMLRSFRGRY